MIQSDRLAGVVFLVVPSSLDLQYRFPVVPIDTTVNQSSSRLNKRQARDQEQTRSGRLERRDTICH